MAPAGPDQPGMLVVASRLVIGQDGAFGRSIMATGGVAYDRATRDSHFAARLSYKARLTASCAMAAVWRHCRALSKHLGVVDPFHPDSFARASFDC